MSAATRARISRTSPPTTWHLSSHFRYKGHGRGEKNAGGGVQDTLSLALEVKTPVYVGVVTLDHEIRCKSLATTSASIWTSSPQ